VRCLFTSKTGSLGHLLPLLPIAEAARAAGDEVAVATSVDRRHDVEAAGHTFFAAGLALGEVGEHFRLMKARLAAGGVRLHPRLGWDLEHTYTQMFPTVQAPVMADDLAKVIEAFRPDVVVCDVGEFGGPVAAAVAGVPCVSHGFGLPSGSRWLGKRPGRRRRSGPSAPAWLGSLPARPRCMSRWAPPRAAMSAYSTLSCPALSTWTLT
jgi:UDP:flavonoid glycosyltransferase YjiC (YdhE family)